MDGLVSRRTGGSVGRRAGQSWSHQGGEYRGLDTEHVSTYYVDMNLTLSIDDRLVMRARKRAEAMGKSLNELIRDYLRSVTDEGAVDDFERELKDLSAQAGGDRRGWRFNRDDLHARP